MAFIEYDPQASSTSNPGFVEYTPPAAGPQLTPRSANFMEQLKRQAGRFARAGITGVTSTGTMLLDASDAIAKLTGLVPKSQQAPSARFQQSLTELGLPVDTTPEEKLTGFGTEMLAGSLDPASKAIQLGTAAASKAPAAFRTGSEQVAETARQLRKAGLVINPQQSGGIVPKTLSAFGGSGRVNAAAQEVNAETLTAWAKRANKIPQSADLNLATLKSQASRLVEEGYAPVERLNRVPIGTEFHRDLGNIVRELADNRSFPMAQRETVRTEVLRNATQDMNPRHPIYTFTGKDAIKRIRDLREEAGELYRKGEDLQLASAKERIAKALEDQIERHLTSLGRPGSDILNTYRSTRAQLAKNFATRKIIDPDTGIVNPAAAHARRAAGELLTDELDLIAKAGSSSFRKSTMPPEGAAPISLADVGFGAIGAGGMIGGNLASGGLFAAVPFAQAASRKAVESKAAQRLMAASPVFTDAARQRMLLQGAGQLAPYSLFLDPTYAGEQ